MTATTRRRVAVIAAVMAAVLGAGALCSAQGNQGTAVDTRVYCGQPTINAPIVSAASHR
jgi:hypothetical protein